MPRQKPKPNRIGENENMKLKLGLAIFFMAVLCVSVAPAFAQSGFDEFGYNYQGKSVRRQS